MIMEMQETGFNLIEDTMRRRHQIFKYGQQWYGNCGICTRSLWSPYWSGAFGLLTLHVQGHQPLTQPSASS